MKKILLIIVAILAMTGCSVMRIGNFTSGTEYYNNLYKGSTHNQIVRDFGAPDRDVSDGAGGYILVYEKFRSSSRVDSFGNVDYDVDKSYIQFFMNDQGICYEVRTNWIAPETQKAIVSTAAISFGALSGLSLLVVLPLMILL
jgi:hypothetical protein